MSRGQYYGKLGVAKLPAEVLAIWYSRDDEMELCEPTGVYSDEETNPDAALDRDLASKLIARTPLSAAQAEAIMLCVIEGHTFREAGIKIGVSSGRVAQILSKALRKLRHQYLILSRKK
jgi:DNA-directed RNA polymerase specialized sigma24 family protein